MKIKNIFLIEDDSFFATTFKKKMEKVGDFAVHHYNTCEDAIDQIRKIDPEIVFMDHVLRGTKGVDAIPAIRHKKPNIQIVVISNQTDINVVDKAFHLGATNYFRKDILLLNYVQDFIHNLQGEYPDNLSSVAL